MFAFVLLPSYWIIKKIEIVITKKGTYRTMSSVPYNRIVNLLKTNDLNEKTRYLVLAVNNSILVGAEDIKS